MKNSGSTTLQGSHIASTSYWSNASKIYVYHLLFRYTSNKTELRMPYAGGLQKDRNLTPAPSKRLVRFFATCVAEVFFHSAYNSYTHVVRRQNRSEADNGIVLKSLDTPHSGFVSMKSWMPFKVSALGVMYLPLHPLLVFRFLPSKHGRHICWHIVQIISFIIPPRPLQILQYTSYSQNKHILQNTTISHVPRVEPKMRIRGPIVHGGDKLFQYLPFS